MPPWHAARTGPGDTKDARKQAEDGIGNYKLKTERGDSLPLLFFCHAGFLIRAFAGLCRGPVGRGSIPTCRAGVFPQGAGLRLPPAGVPVRPPCGAALRWDLFAWLSSGDCLKRMYDSAARRETSPEYNPGKPGISGLDGTDDP